MRWVIDEAGGRWPAGAAALPARERVQVGEAGTRARAVLGAGRIRSPPNRTGSASDRAIAVAAPLSPPAFIVLTSERMAAAYPIDFAAAPLTGTTEDRLRALGVPVVTADDVRAAEAAWPQTEPDRSVWRILSNARAAGDELSDEQLRTALPACSIEEIAAARARVEGRIASEPMEITSTTTIHDLLAEPSITLDEAFACGLLDDRSDSESAERTSCDPDAEPACASST